MSAETETETKTDNFLSLSITKGPKLTDARGIYSHFGRKFSKFEVIEHLWEMFL